MTEQNELDLITLEEGGDLLGLGIATFKKLIDEGKIPAVQVSDKLRKVRKQDVISYINNQVKTPDNKPTSKLAEVDEQIQLVKKEQELEALKAGFKNVDDYKLALSAVLSEQTKLAEQKEKYETSFKSLEVDRKAFELFKKEGEGEIAQGKAKNLEEKEKVLKMLRLGEIDGVAFYALDRWGRTMSELVLELEEFSKSGKALISLKEGLDLSNAAGRLMANVLAAMANFERDRIRERTILGLARAKAQGKKLGRPRKEKTPPENLPIITEEGALSK